MRPEVTAFTEELYARLGAGWDGVNTRSDEATGWHLLKFLESFGQTVQPVEDLVRDTEDGPGWSQVTDIDRVPSGGIGWLSQLVGVELLAGLADLAQRERTKEMSGFKRGTPAALLGAVRGSLTGGQRARLQERVGGNAYQMRLITYTAETPDPVRTCQLAQTQKAMGNILTCDVRDGQTWDELRDGAGGRTWDEVNTEFDDWNDVRENIP